MFEGIVWAEVVLPLAGLVIGAILSWLVPYLRAGLELVQETGSWAEWPAFNPSYLAMTLYPLLLIAVSALTVEGAFAEILALDFISAVLYTYASARVGHEAVKGIQAGVKLLRQ